MLRTTITLIPFFIFLFSAAACTADVSALTPKEAILEMEKHPFDQAVLLRSAKSLEQVLKENPNDAWAIIGMAEAYLRVGYKSGSRYEKNNYAPEVLDKAYAFAQRAVELAPINSRAHALLAKLQIIRGEYETAWKTLNQAHKLDPGDFYSWYYLVVLNRYYQLYDDAKHYADRAESLAQYTHHHRWVIQQRLDIADALNDLEAEERGHLQIIELEPDRAYSYGNYATFLYNQKRYQEAITYFEKTIDISAYPLAVRLLKKSRQRLEEAPVEQ